MEIISSLSNWAPREKTVLVLGNFDGVHLGHRALFNEALKYGDFAVRTFKEIAKPNNKVELLTDFEERVRLFKLYRASYAIFDDFEKLKNLTPEEFVVSCVPFAKRIICGYNYRFGKGGGGDAKLLCRLCAERGVECTVVQPVMSEDGEVISSSIIRSFIAEGNIEKANMLLGHPYSITADVSKGASFGRKMNIPTINQSPREGFVKPKRGVYSCIAHVGGAEYPATANVGICPTVKSLDAEICETYIHGFTGDLYGEKVRIKFIKFLREEKRFSSVEALYSQITEDIAASGEFLTEYLQKLK